MRPPLDRLPEQYDEDEGEVVRLLGQCLRCLVVLLATGGIVLGIVTAIVYFG